MSDNTAQQLYRVICGSCQVGYGLVFELGYAEGEEDIDLMMYKHAAETHPLAFMTRPDMFAKLFPDIDMTQWLQEHAQKKDEYMPVEAPKEEAFISEVSDAELNELNKLTEADKPFD